jgi:hypothetical protein
MYLIRKEKEIWYSCTYVCCLEVISSKTHCKVFETSLLKISRIVIGFSKDLKRFFGTIIKKLASFTTFYWLNFSLLGDCSLIVYFISLNVYFFTFLLGLLQRYSGIFLWRSKWVQKFLEKVCRKPWLLPLLSCETCSEAENPCLESRFFLQVCATDLYLVYTLRVIELHFFYFVFLLI